MTTSSPTEPGGSLPQQEMPGRYRLAAGLGAILMLAAGFVSALQAPGAAGIVAYAVGAVVAGAAGVSLYVATRHNRGYQSTQTTSLSAGLFVLVAVVDVIMFVIALVGVATIRLVDLRFGVLLVTVVLALFIGGIGLFGVARGQRSREHLPPADPERARARIAEIDELAAAEMAMGEGEATPEQEAKVIEDARLRSEEHRRESWARAREDEQRQRGSTR